MRRALVAAAVAGAALVPTLASGPARAEAPPAVVENRDNGTCIWISHQQGHCLDIAGVTALLQDLLKGQQALAQGLTL